MSLRAAPWVWAVPVVAGASAVAALVVHARTAALTGVDRELYLADLWVGLTYPVAGALLAGLLVDRWLVLGLLSTALLSVTGLAVTVATFDATDQVVSAGGRVAAWLATWTWTPYLLIPAVLPLLYPTYPRRPRWLRILVGASLALVAVVAVLSSLAPGPVDGIASAENPLGVEAWAGWLASAAALPALALLVAGPLAVLGLLVGRVRHEVPGSGAALVGAACFLVAALSAGALPYPWNDVWTALGATVLPVALVLDSHVATRRAADQATVRRLVLMRDEERSRIRQDLHDGLAPRLAGLGLRLDGLERSAATLGPDGGAGDLAEVSTELRESVTEIRRIVDGLAPRAVDELGLVGAVQACADRVAPGVVTVTADELPTVPPAVAGTAYFVVAEALANAVRHAHPSRVEVRVEVVALTNRLRVVVTDDGWGGAVPRPGGLGLSGMAQRVEGLGGRLRIQPADPVGTTIEALVPLEPG